MLRELWPYGACYLLCIIRTDTHQLLLWMTRRQGQKKKKLLGVQEALSEGKSKQAGLVQ